MEPPMLGGEEECHSNESGWTMYIGSPRDEDSQHCDDDHHHHSFLEEDYDYESAAAAAQHSDVESDDSMVSDASSGPSKSKEEVNKKGKKYYCSEKKVEKKNEIMAFNSKDKATAAVHQHGSKVKVKKNYRVGTRKS